MTHSNSCILAVDAGGTSLKAALIPENGSPEEWTAMAKRTFFSVDVHSDGTKEEILGAYEELGREGSRQAAEMHSPISRIAVCIPGPFRYADGTCLMTHKYQAVYGVSLTPSLLTGVGISCPVTFLHDSTAFLLGAELSASNQGNRTCGVIIGTGLGFACIIDGKVQSNPAGGPGISIYARPYLEGTSEDYVSKRGIMNRYLAEPGSDHDPSLTVAQIAGMARSGDPVAAKVFADTGFHLGQILYPILEANGFDTLLLGGAISKSADLFLPRLNQVLEELHVSALQADNIDLAPLLGAARYQDTLIQIRL